MAKVCVICDKSYSSVVKRSHSMRPNKVRLQPNLQWTRLDGKRIRACTRCIRTTAKKAATQ